MPARVHPVSRLEGFSDAVFGLALTLLVVTLEAPKNNDDLRRLIGGLIPLALMFAMVCWIWYEHNVFFRRYGLQDPWTVFLNSVLLFVVLFYVYPLKFLTTGLADAFAGRPTLREVDTRLLMLIYSGGVLTIFVTFILLHRHAWSKRRVLGLDALDLLRLRFSTNAHAISAGLAAVSLTLALVSRRLAPIAGMLYFLMGPLHAWNGYRAIRAYAAHDAETARARSVSGSPSASADDA